MASLPPGFEVESAPKPRRGGMAFRGIMSIPATAVPHDGDTFPLGDGLNGRLYGVDAPELSQPGFSPNGTVVDLGAQARAALTAQMAGGGKAKPVGPSTYGRPVVTLDTATGDAGRGMVRSGNALPEPRYLSGDTGRLSDYVHAQDQAIADERGMYGTVFQAPWDYRHGTGGPLMGKVPLSDQQKRSYLDLVLSKGANASALDNWYSLQGRAATNLPNILQYQRRFTSPTPPAYFQQQDVQGTPILPSNPGLAARMLNRFNTGVMDLAAMPGDLVANLAGRVGINIPSASEGTAYIGRKTGFTAAPGDPNFAPRSTLERYAGSVAENAGQSVLPLLGTFGAGMRVAGTANELAPGFAPVVRNALRGVMESPGRNLAAEAGGVVGSGLAGQAAQDYAPDNQYLNIAAQLAGGFAGGLGAGVATSRGAPLHEAVQTGAKMGEEQAQSNAQQNLEQNANGKRKDAPNAPVGGDYLPPIQAPAGVAQWNSEGAPLVGMVEDGAGNLAPQYGIPGQPGSRPAAPTPRPAVAAQSADIPEGFVLEGPEAPALPAPRSRDMLDVRGPQLPPGFVYEQPTQIGRPYPMGQRPSADQIAQLARGVAPGDLLPIPSNEVGSMHEAASIGAGMYEPVKAPNERDALPPYTLPGQARPRRNPLDLASWLRAQGGVADTGGDLAHLGIDNRPRDMDFAKDEGFLGPLVNPNGMPVDEAARAAWEAGYFPDHYDRPTPNDFLDALHETHRGGAARVFHPSDYEAIDNYNAARENRHLVEQAQAEGSPLVHDLSQPVNLDDLIANSAPLSAFVDQPPARSGRVGNISLDKLDTNEAVGRLLTNIRAKFGGFDAARRGKMTHEETASLARQLNMTPDELMKRPAAQAMNAEQAHAMASLLAKSSDELVTLARKAQGGTDAEKAAFMQAVVRHAAIQEQVEGARAEAGRALSAMRMTASSKDVSGRIHKAIIDNAGGNDRVEQVARDILDIANTTGDPGKVGKIAKAAATPSIGDKLSEVYINSLLSGPQTHAANFLSNSLTAALQIPEHAMAATLGAFRGGPDRVMPGEVQARVFGMLQGTREGLRQFARTSVTGDVPDHMAKVENAEQHAISGIKGSVIRTPTRMLSAADELFKGIARRSEINGMAYRQAKAEGLKGDAFKNRVAALSSNPTPEMEEQARKYARYVTFQTPLGPIGQSVSRVSQWKPMNVPVGKFIVPFVRTPANLIKFAAERSPAAPMLPDWRKDFLAGGARRDLAVSKAVLGSGMGLLFYQMAKDGKITGSGPADDNARALMQADGWQPYSIKVGDKWVSYARMDPLSTTMGVAADLATKGDQMTQAQRDHASVLVASSVIQNLSNKTWLSGVSDLVDAIEDRSGSKVGSYLRNEAASVAVPAILAQIARASDPQQRDTSTVGNAIKSRVPILSQQVPARLNVWGNPVPREGLPMGLSAVSPFNVSTPKGDPVTAQLLASGVHVNKPSPSIAGVKLTPEQMRAYQMAIGKGAYPAVAGTVGGPDWAGMTNDQRQDAVSDALRQVREDARNSLGFNWQRAKAQIGGGDIPPGFEVVPPGFVIEHVQPPKGKRLRLFGKQGAR